MILRVSFALSILSSTAAYSQGLLEGINSGGAALLPADAAILDGHEVRTDLNCAVKPVDPRLGFDLRFHGGYDVTVPLQDLAGGGTTLTANSRVSAAGHQEPPVQ